ncbi:hypothetical protein [Mucilaginibacter sp. 44-25]|uniref:hypothetical protein n=1 Tax=Mucilaginibacter sp. 44-25 TaxID=1895794 RepID=UPI0025DD1A04|nr:hypothetical protein [Mucilaginibacter sp. 44-25]
MSVPEPEESDPCDEMKKDKDMLPGNLNNTVSDILSKPGTNEWGADLRLSSLTSRTYNPTSITSGVNGAWDGTFTWNPSEGFSIGAMHKHFATGPSPDDVFSFVKNRQKLSDIGASDVEKQFYEKNSYEIVVLNNATFMITVNPGWWGTLKNMSNNGTDYENIFRNQIIENQNTNQTDELTASVAALQQIFGEAINVYKAPMDTTNFAIVNIDQNGNLIIITCP